MKMILNMVFILIVELDYFRNHESLLISFLAPLASIADRKPYRSPMLPNDPHLAPVDKGGPLWY